MLGLILLEYENEALGLDMFIGEEKYLNKGFGKIITKEIVKLLFQDKNVPYLIIDPETTNHAAVKCYEKAGFKIVKKINQDYGECFLMQINRLEF